MITILAILGTIAFISLQGYSADARNTKRTNDIASIAEKIFIKLSDGSFQTSSVGATGATVCKLGSGTLSGTGVDFGELKEDGTKFKDPNHGCDYGYDYGTYTYSGKSLAGPDIDVIEQMFRVTAVSDDYNTLMEKGRWFGSGTTGVVISSENKYGN